MAFGDGVATEIFGPVRGKGRQLDVAAEWILWPGGFPENNCFSVRFMFSFAW